MTTTRLRGQRIVDFGVPMTTRDGVELSSVIHRVEAQLPQPIVLIRNPYGEWFTRSLPIVTLMAAGFAVVIQDCRGTGDSDGDFSPFETEELDTLDAIAWCTELPFSNGAVVMYGASYSGMVQLAAAVNRPPGLAGIIPFVAPHDYQTGVAYRNGALQLGQITGWYTMKSSQHIPYLARRGHDVANLAAEFAGHASDVWKSIASRPLANAPGISRLLPAWTRWVTDEERTPFWASIGYRDRRSAIAVPALHIGGWFDLFLGGTLDNFVTVSTSASTLYTRNEQRLIVGPWQHIDQSGNVGELSFGALASWAGAGIEARIAEFSAAAAKGEPIPGPPVRIFVMGANVWRDEQEWPLARTEWTPWYLHGNGTLSSESPTVIDSSTPYRHDPADPVPMRGGQSGVGSGGLDGGNEWTAGPRDQRPLDDRTDILRFVSEPLTDDLEVTGPVTVTLYAASTADDTDFVARLVDVNPDGRALGVVDGIVRAKFRVGQDQIRPIVPGEVYEYQIDLWATSWLFKAGHRVRVEVASSSYPNWLPNSGELVAPGATVVGTGVPADQTIHHSVDRPSHITLPVIPA